MKKEKIKAMAEDVYKKAQIADEKVQDADLAVQRLKHAVNALTFELKYDE